MAGAIIGGAVSGAERYRFGSPISPAEGITNQPRYQISRPRRLLNRVVRPLARLGLAGRHTYILSVPRRKSGGTHTTPVSLVENADGRWLVSPYGETGWVRNARVARHVTLSRAGRSETVPVAELAAVDAAPVLRTYLKTYRFVQPFFEVRRDSRLEDFAAEAPRHPVFAIHASTTLSPDIDHDRV